MQGTTSQTFESRSGKRVGLRQPLAGNAIVAHVLGRKLLEDLDRFETRFQSCVVPGRGLQKLSGRLDASCRRHGERHQGVFPGVKAETRLPGHPPTLFARVSRKTCGPVRIFR